MSPSLLRSSLLAVACLATALASTAHADPEGAASGPPGLVVARPDLVAPSVEVSRTRWYGWQILVTDAASIAGASVSGGVTLGGYLLGGPIVHLVHGKGGRAAASLGLRVGAPLALGLLAGESCDESDYDDQSFSFGCAGEAMAGMLVGAAAASVVDAIWSTETVVESLPFTPTIQADGRGAVLGLGGSF